MLSFAKFEFYYGRLLLFLGAYLLVHVASLAFALAACHSLTLVRPDLRAARRRALASLAASLPPAIAVLYLGAPLKFGLPSTPFVVASLGALVFWRVCRRREERAARGLCVGCGYDLRGSGERCPECGRWKGSSVSEPPAAAGH
jgi:hypothetical protein